MDSNIHSISSNTQNVRQDVFPLGQWTITTRKGIIMQSRCTCQNSNNNNQNPQQQSELSTNEITDISDKLCNICKYSQALPQLYSMPDMLFNNNVLRLEHYTGIGVEFNALDALKLVEETKDPLRVAVADGWQSTRDCFPFARSIVKPFDWTFTTDYRGTLLTAIKKQRALSQPHYHPPAPETKVSECNPSQNIQSFPSDESSEPAKLSEASSVVQDEKQNDDNLLQLDVEETNERIDVNKLKVREEILFYDDITLYEDELADHGTAQYSVKVRVMPKSLFILARFYLRIDGVLARINDTRIYHELNRNYLLREYTNRESKLSTLDLPVSTLVNPNELMNHLPIMQSRYEKLTVPKSR